MSAESFRHVHDNVFLSFDHFSDSSRTIDIFFNSFSYHSISYAIDLLAHVLPSGNVDITTYNRPFRRK